MRRVTFLVSDEQVPALVQATLAYAKDLQIVAVGEPEVPVPGPGRLPWKLEPPPPGALKAFRQRGSRRRPLPRPARSPLYEAIRAAIMAWLQREGTIRSEDISALARQHGWPVKTAQNALHGLRNRGLLEPVGAGGTGRKLTYRLPNESPLLEPSESMDSNLVERADA